MKNVNKLSTFALRIIAMVTMTFDHIGVVMASIWGTNQNYNFYLACRYIGRIALPIFCFLLVEAVIHTHSYKKYSIKLGIMAAIISIGLAVCQFVPNLGLESVANAGNIFLDLLLGSLMIYCLRHDKKWVKALALIPLAISILSFVAKAYEAAESCTGCAYKTTVLWYPAFLRLQYDWMSLAYMLGFYLAYEATKLVYKIREESTGLKADMMMGTNEWRMMVNLFGVLFGLIVTISYYMITYINNDIVFWVPRIQVFALTALVFTALYSGEKGYSSKWFANFSYLYYLVHIGVIFGICYLIYII
ncbi:MAG: conjugal transfer protein TraX [Bacilli bacterium]|nr:conjugal transfer protein TraX [Bacilli bacterium]